jgi:acyl-CoA thioester hydrolase
MRAADPHSANAQAPVETRVRIPPEWTDANGHMNVAYYVLAFDRATDALYDRLGVGWAILEDDRSMFTLAMNVDYLREVLAGDSVRIVSRLIDGDEKRVHYLHEMYRDETLAATNEIVALHVDMRSRRGARFPDDVLERIDRVKSAHAALPWPPQRGRALGLHRRETKRATG